MHRSSTLVTLTALAVLVGACYDDRTTAPEPGGPRYTKVSQRLRVDQSNATSDGLGLSNGFYGQSFVPRTSNLARADIRLIVNQVPAEGTYASLGLYTDMNHPAVDSLIVFVAPPAPGEIDRVISYVFAAPIPLVKGATYILGWHGDATTSWEFTYSNAYTSGQALLSDGTPLNPSADFVFTTYALK